MHSCPACRKRAVEAEQRRHNKEPKDDLEEEEIAADDFNWMMPETSTNHGKRENSAPPDSKEQEEGMLETLEMTDLSSKSSKASKSCISVISAKPTSPLYVRGIPNENQAQFKFLSKALNMKHHEFFLLLMANFAEHNPEIINKLTGTHIKLGIEYKEPPKTFQPPSAEAYEILKQTKKILETKQLSQKGLVFRCDQLLRPLLSDKNIPNDQKAEIASFINDVVSGKLKGIEAVA